VNGQASKAEIYDVFLCHNNVDKPAVREIAKKLSKEHIKAWLDEEQIRPGTSWQRGAVRYPTAAIISPDRLVCCAYGAQTLKRGSVKMRRSHTAFRQRQRPRCSRRITCVPWTGRSRRERQYQLWREREMRWQPGQIAEFWPSASMIKPWSVLNTRRSVTLLKSGKRLP
jgi:hypothetical protein